MKRVTAILVASFLVLLFPLAADFCASDAFASPAEDSWNVNLIGRWGWTLGGDCAAVACHGDTVYFINGRYVNVVDFSNPEVPVEIGKVSIQSSEENIFINLNGSYAFAAQLLKTKIISILDPENPQVIGEVDATGRLYVKGAYLYITYFDFGLIIYDLSNPASPVQIGSYETDFAERATAVSGDYAYIACRDSGLVVLDISDPGSPFEVSRLPGKAWDVAISGQYAFIAAEAAGLRVIDISDPDSLQEVDSYSTPLDALDVMVRDGYAYVRLPESGLSAKDVSAYYQGDSQNNKGDLAVGDVSAYVIDELAWYGGYGCGIRSIGISDPDHLGQNGYYLTYGSIQDVDLIGDYAYLAAVWGGLRAIDVSNPQAPGEVGYVNADHIEDLCLGLVIKNEDQAYMRTGICDLRWVSLADPTFYYREYINYTLCYETGGHAKAIALANDTVYTIEEGSQGSGGFHIYDEDIDEIGYVYSAASGRDMAIEGDYAFIATESTGLVVIDISDPTAPDEIAAYGSSYGTMNGIEVSGDYAYVAAYNHGLKVIDISDPSSPGEVGGYDTSGKPRDVALSGSTVYLADGSTGVRVIDVSGPTAPEEIGYYDMEGDAYKVKVAPDGRVYAACGSGGFISSNTLL